MGSWGPALGSKGTSLGPLDPLGTGLSFTSCVVNTVFSKSAITCVQRPFHFGPMLYIHTRGADIFFVYSSMAGHSLAVFMCGS